MSILAIQCKGLQLIRSKITAPIQVSAVRNRATCRRKKTDQSLEATYFHRLICRSIFLLLWGRQYAPPKHCAHILVHSVLYPQKTGIFISASSWTYYTLNTYNTFCSHYTISVVTWLVTLWSAANATHLRQSKNKKCSRRTKIPTVRQFHMILHHSFKASSLLESLLYQ